MQLPYDRIVEGNMMQRKLSLPEKDEVNSSTGESDTEDERG